MIDKIQENLTASSYTTLKVTPDQLRLIANRLDLQIKNSLPGQLIIYPVSKNVLFMFDPEVTIDKLERNFLEKSKNNNTLLLPVESKELDPTAYTL